ncbi:MAG: hypothetical protein L0Y58_02315 [Verrucomicrobia subdivision 3 bacterium]|nr:hypothetical protein [Limisphaerales bacterium]
MPVAIDEVRGEVEPAAALPREEEAEDIEAKMPELEKVRREARRLEQREARLRAN